MMNLEKAFVLLTIVEKAQSHPNLRSEATAQLDDMEKACIEEVKKRNEVKAEEQRKVEAEQAAKKKEEADRAERERQAEARAEREAKDPRINRPIAPELGNDPTPGQPRGIVSPAVPEAQPGETPAELSARLEADRKRSTAPTPAADPEIERRL